MTELTEILREIPGLDALEVLPRYRRPAKLEHDELEEAEQMCKPKELEESEETR